MGCYEALAPFYDELTDDVGYARRADFIETLFRRAKRPVQTVLDLACGTGTMTALLTERGYELIGTDASEEMLMAAQEKMRTLRGVPPLLLHQSMTALDLYGTVDAAICCLDSLNYLTREQDVRRVLARVHLFVAPGGVFVFDVHGVGKLERLDDQVFLDERDDLYCVWRTAYRKRSRILDYAVDLFRRRGDGTWDRRFEEHHQRGYTAEELTAWLREAGFADIRVYGDCVHRAPRESEDRLYFSCVRK